MRIEFLFFLLLVQLCWCCINITPKSCRPENRFFREFCRCQKIKDGALCCNIDSEYVFKKSLECSGISKNGIKHLYLYNTSLENFDAGSESWTRLESLTITHSKLKKINGWFRGNIKCVNFSSNALNEMDSKTFIKLKGLHTLDLSNNNLVKLPDLSVGIKNFSLDISENKLIRCSEVRELLELNKNNNLTFRNRNATVCQHQTSFSWFNSTDSMSLSQVESGFNTVSLLGLECPNGTDYQCDCMPFRIDIMPGEQPKSTIKVNCSGRHLTELPTKLPPNTVHLDISNNNITSLDPLCKNPLYRQVREFIADNNKIEAINSLEGSNFMDNFAILSLKDNRLKTIPIYILSNAFDRNWHQFVYLGGNKLNCDCSTAQVLKLWLQANKNHIPDYGDIMCEKDLERVKFLDQNKVCVYQKDWTDYIYYIIAGEVLLLILLVSKVSYDYWVFKTSGYLPWPASNMPKLPCDWVFET